MQQKFIPGESGIDGVRKMNGLLIPGPNNIPRLFGSDGREIPISRFSGEVSGIMSPTVRNSSIQKFVRKGILFSVGNISVGSLEEKLVRIKFENVLMPDLSKKEDLYFYIKEEYISLLSEGIDYTVCA
ncbi:MAG: hypothetical protein PHO80_00720 [Candidatus Gracilibacteria bacterium]|nr:hypothetical protein [Candidatus Gracilibacteria bacterium]MDD4530059.1 hypothetical protein [Candidatus Gracilibacteria bacterium]